MRDSIVCAMVVHGLATERYCVSSMRREKVKGRGCHIGASDDRVEGARRERKVVNGKPERDRCQALTHSGWLGVKRGHGQSSMSVFVCF